ncbi:hypothetical protein J2T13_001334 [Paenibacillus sp. DS2015]|uniref:DUF6932 family protein n=1 Tax=Paenibacillus sp. DS2015 TaxID=3373917 RepID=UPI003D1C012D
MLIFNDQGLLAAQDYPMTLDEIRTSLLVTGPKDGSPWDMDKRMTLVNNLEVLVNQLWRVGILDIFIDGSFVEDKASPGDIDGYFVADVRTLPDIVRELNSIDPYKIWSWKERIYDRNSAKSQLPMWHRYKVELYPHVGQSSGILDEHGLEQMFPAAFRKTRDSFEPKGIVKIIK